MVYPIHKRAVTSRWAAVFIGLVIIATSSSVFSSESGRKVLTLTGQELRPLISINKGNIFFESDTLLLNGRQLASGRDYSFHSFPARFELKTSINPAVDTLLISYWPLPNWLKASYGRPVADVKSEQPSQRRTITLPVTQPVQTNQSGVDISGSKSFRFSARNSGSSDFSQSIDLSLSGDLAPGVKIQGSVSDRGFDPSYGTANSRLSELDKVNLSIESKKVTARVGDINIKDRMTGSSGGSRSITGASLSIDGDRYYFDAAAARSKGRHESSRFFGSDGIQGPYALSQSGSARPVVPGSETVWLDGRQLELGAHKDYIVDYPTGRITFSVNHPINSRSRIEIDFQPQGTKYKEQYLSSGSGMSVGDSAFYFDLSLAREGDDYKQPLIGELSDSDKQILEAAGENSALAYRSGIRADTLGDYLLDIASLPDSVYTYVGLPNGDYSITFSYVGTGTGDYRFLGGNNYEFAGFSLGEFSPIITIEAPQRIEYLQSRFGIKSNVMGDLQVSLHESRHDANLLSSLDDDNNNGLYYSVRSRKRWRINNRQNELVIRSSKREKRFHDRGRYFKVDLPYRFLSPYGNNYSGGIELHEVLPVFSPGEKLTLRPLYSELRLDDNFISRLGGFSLELLPLRKVMTKTKFEKIDARLDTLSTERWGRGSIYGGLVKFSLSSDHALTLDVNYDSRKNNYTQELRGTRFIQYAAKLRHERYEVALEHFDEDSLAKSWQERLRRTKAQISSSGKYKRLDYDITTAYQRLEQSGKVETGYLGRLDYRYSSSSRSSDVGGTYNLSEENRNARSIVYLEVEPGLGDYNFEDGEYRPDPDGNFIRVEELLSEQQSVRRGGKSFFVTHDFQFAMVRFRSNIKEELLPGGNRTAWWALPFYSDKTERYLFYSRRYDLDLRLIPIRVGHFAVIALNEDIETRDFSGSERRRTDREGSLTLREAAGTIFLEQKAELFSNDRDSYFIGSGDISGYLVGASVTSQKDNTTVTFGGKYRHAEADVTIGETQSSKTFVIEGEVRIRFRGSGELRVNSGFYDQKLTGVVGTPSYTLTDNRHGSKGADWSVNLARGLGKEMKLNFSISGRHTDTRSARITARGEFVAGF